MKFLYKYPQLSYPYADLVDTNRRRNRHEMEYELIDTGVFDQDRYFDVFVEYAKQSPEDILIRITAVNRGKESATLHVLPTLWFRNTWSWYQSAPKPLLEETHATQDHVAITASHPDLGVRYLYAQGPVPILFTENETNQERISGRSNQSPYVKDGINDYVIHQCSEKVNPNKVGTKASPHYAMQIPGGESHVIQLRLSNLAPEALGAGGPFGAAFTNAIDTRRKEADEFYGSITPDSVDRDKADVMRQALAGMLWSKQYYSYDVDLWRSEHAATYEGRNSEWVHMINQEVISMPDKWEYPWYAAWDLAFHTVTLAMVDPEFAKQQIDLMLRDDYLHPSGQLPAYEWNFGDVNPPVHAWATRFVYQLEKQRLGRGDTKFLEKTFQKLALNFAWWVNRKDPRGKNIFGGGFLGLDNIGVFDRSAPLPTGGHLEQADGTAWMAFYCQCMLQMAIELAIQNPSYEDMVVKFAKHFAWIALAMEDVGDGHESMWDEEDGFFYDILRLPDGSATRLKVRSLVGLLPLCAATIFRGEIRTSLPHVLETLTSFYQKHPKISSSLSLEPALKDGVNGTRLLGLMDERKFRRVLSRMLDETEFLGPHGIRSISRYHLDRPYVFRAADQEYRVQYVPAESDTGMFGGNSNWRGPVWMPINVLIVRSLLNLYQYYGDDFRVECPTGSGKLMNLFEIAQEITNRLIRTFTRDENGRRPVYGGTEKFQTDPHWRDYILFCEYFHGDNGAGIGASHQTGWTGTIANLIQLFGHLKASEILAGTAELMYVKEPTQQVEAGVSSKSIEAA
jgi:hypothetical protein